MKINKISFNIIISLGIFFILSILSIYSTRQFLKDSLSNLYIKQIIFYIIGIFITIFINFKGFNLLKKYHLLIYIGINILLLFLLIFAYPVNGSKCWLFIGPFSFQPSEIMKISLIITLTNYLNQFNFKKEHTRKEEFYLIIKLLIITLIPSILTFLEPDTGVVIIYFLILFTMLILANLNKKWYLISFFIISLLVAIFSLLYFFKNELFISLIGNNMYYRIDRILNWTNNSGYQLENSLLVIANSGLLGFGFNQNFLYFPEPQTDFIFTTLISNFGFIGGIFLITIIIIFDVTILKLVTKKIKYQDKLILIGIFIILFYGQIQNIGMTLGLLPITGIPLPFISYGGSSLISYLFIIGIILNINRERLKYRN